MTFLYSSIDHDIVDINFKNQLYLKNKCAKKVEFQEHGKFILIKFFSYIQTKKIIKITKMFVLKSVIFSNTLMIVDLSNLNDPGQYIVKSPQIVQLRAGADSLSIY
jgi:hypothetical protein